MKTLASSLLASAAVSAHAGLYSVVGIRWLVPTDPGSGTNGGAISLVSSPYRDVRYSISGSVSATHTLMAECHGNFEYVIHWVSTVPGEPTPISSLCKFQIRKAGSTLPIVSVGGHCFTGGYLATSSATIVDSFFLPLSTSGSTSAAGTSYYNEQTSSAAPDVYYATSNFFEVTPGTWEAYAGFGISTQASLSASASNTGAFPYSASSASCSLSAQIRLTEVAGQTVQPDL